MKQLRWLVILLVLCLTLLMNLERLDFGGTNLINMSTFVYVLGCGSLVAILALQPRLRLPPYVLVAVMLLVYSLLKIFVFNTHSILGGIATYVTVTEVTLLTVVVMLGARLSAVLSEFEAVVNKLIFPETGARVIRLSDAMERIKVEMNKSRRHNRPLSIILVEPTVESVQDWFNHLVKEVKLALTTRYLLNLLAAKVADVTRRSDFLIEETNRKRFIILCPETGGKELPQLRDRIKAIADNSLSGVTVDFGFASFPDGALTFEELLQEAERQLENGSKAPHFPKSESDISESDIKVLDKHGTSATKRKRYNELG